MQQEDRGGGFTFYRSVRFLSPCISSAWNTSAYPFCSMPEPFCSLGRAQPSPVRAFLKWRSVDPLSVDPPPVQRPAGHLPHGDSSHSVRGEGGSQGLCWPTPASSSWAVPPPSRTPSSAAFRSPSSALRSPPSLCGPRSSSWTPAASAFLVFARASGVALRGEGGTPFLQGSSHLPGDPVSTSQGGGQVGARREQQGRREGRQRGTGRARGAVPAINGGGPMGGAGGCGGRGWQQVERRGSRRPTVALKGR